MAGPWEDFQKAAPAADADGPWNDFAPKGSKSSPGADIAKSGLSGIASGAAQIAGLPVDFVNALGKALGRNPEIRTGSSAQLTGAIAPYLHQPETTAGRAANYAGSWLPAFLGGPETAAAKLITRFAAPLAGSTAGGAAFEGTQGEDLARLVGGGGLSGLAMAKARSRAAARAAKSMEAAALEEKPLSPAGQKAHDAWSNVIDESDSKQDVIKGARRFKRTDEYSTLHPDVQSDIDALAAGNAKRRSETSTLLPLAAGEALGSMLPGAAPLFMVGRALKDRLATRSTINAAEDIRLGIRRMDTGPTAPAPLAPIDRPGPSGPGIGPAPSPWAAPAAPAAPTAPIARPGPTGPGVPPFVNPWAASAPAPASATPASAAPSGPIAPATPQLSSPAAPASAPVTLAKSITKTRGGKVTRVPIETPSPERPAPEPRPGESTAATTAANAGERAPASVSKPAPTPSTLGGEYDGIPDFLRRTAVKPAAPTATPAAAPEQARPAATYQRPTEAQPALAPERMHEAFLRQLGPVADQIRAGQGGISNVYIGDLLAKSGLPKDEVHAALQWGAQRGLLSLHRASPAESSLTAAQREGAINTEGQRFHTAVFNKPQPAPSQPALAALTPSFAPKPHSQMPFRGRSDDEAVAAEEGAIAAARRTAEGKPGSAADMAKNIARVRSTIRPVIASLSKSATKADKALLSEMREQMFAAHGSAERILARDHYLPQLSEAAKTEAKAALTDKLVRAERKHGPNNYDPAKQAAAKQARQEARKTSRKTPTAT